jgi:hypothetical protein
MDVFGHHHHEGLSDKETIEILLKILKIESQMAQDLVDRLPKPDSNKPIFTLSTNIQNQLFIMADLSLVLGTPKTGLFTLTDNKTGAVLTPKFSNQALGTNSNPEFATFALAPTDPTDPTSLNSLVATPVAAGSGSVVITTDASYTDSSGVAGTGSFTQTKKFSVTLAADGVSFDVVFP